MKESELHKQEVLAVVFMLSALNSLVPMLKKTMSCRDTPTANMLRILKAPSGEN